MRDSLNDDMIKLVRYSILTIERDREAVLVPSAERLVTDNLSEDAFAAWMISEHRAELGGTANQYLRVTVEVADRWAKQDRKFEKRQLQVLGEIRDRMPVAPPPPAPPGQPFAEIARRFDANQVRLKYLRQGFKLGAKTLAADIASAFAQFRDLGEFVAIPIVEADLATAFEQGAQPAQGFDPAGLESFPAYWHGVNREFEAAGTERTASAAHWYMTWEPGVYKPGEEYLQNVVGSKLKNFDSAALPALSEHKVDLALNVWRPDIGIAGWLSMWVESRNELALISYELSQGTFLWIGQILSEDLVPVMGEKFFWMFFEWIDLSGDAKHYFMYGLQFQIDFETGRAQLFGDSFRKARFDIAG